MLTPIVLTAPSAAALGEAAGSLVHAGVAPEGLPRFGRDLAARADPTHPYRTVLLAEDPADLAAVAPVSGPVPAPEGLAFLFSGQSSQRPGMGVALGREFPEFGRVVDEVCAHVDARRPTPLGAILADPGEPGPDGLRAIDRTEHTQPALLAFALGLHGLLGTAGIAPDVVCGHSFGELAAAAATGVWTVPDACDVVVERGRLIAALPPGGTMTAIAASEADVAPALRGTGVEFSAVHAPDSVVIAGPVEQVRAIAAAYDARGVRTTELAVGNAYHSAAVEPVLEPLRTVLEKAPAGPSGVPLVGNTSGGVVEPGAPAAAEHWLRHVRHTVRWSDVMTTLRARGTGTYLEIGPSGVLSRLAVANLDPADADAVVPAVTGDPDEVTTFLHALARLDARGHPVDWPSVFAASTTLSA
ncbi:MAG: acyltransferase domain-containing protein [Pseudonocardia sediminis]